MSSSPFAFKKEKFVEKFGGCVVKVLRKGDPIIINARDVHLWGEKDFYGKRILSFSYDAQSPDFITDAAKDTIKALKELDEAFFKYILKSHATDFNFFCKEMSQLELDDYLDRKCGISSTKGFNQKIYLNVVNSIHMEAGPPRRIPSAKLKLNHIWISQSGNIKWNLSLVGCTE